MDVIAELKRQEELERWARGVRWCALVGGVGCSVLLAYRIYLGVGVWGAVGALASLGVLYKVGVGQMFLVAAVALWFVYRVPGVWLPLVAAAAWGWMFWVAWRGDQLLRRIDPNRSSTE